MGCQQWPMEGEGQSQGEKEETGGSQEEGQGAEVCSGEFVLVYFLKRMENGFLQL